MLRQFLKDLFFSKVNYTQREASSLTTNKKLLNVGGNNKLIPIPHYYNGWQHDLLDFDKNLKPDVLCDARELSSLASSIYDSVYCSHNLEHYYDHDVERVLNGFLHILNDKGFVYIVVPDIKGVVETMIDKKLDIEDVLYTSPAGPITVKDVIYGWGLEIKKSHNDFFAHKTGFTQKSLNRALHLAGFKSILCIAKNLEIIAIAFKKQLDDSELPPLENNPAFYLANKYLQKGFTAEAEMGYRYLLDLYPDSVDIKAKLEFVSNLIRSTKEPEKTQ